MPEDDSEATLEELDFEPTFLDPGRLAAAREAADILGGRAGSGEVIELAEYLLGDDVVLADEDE